MNSQSCPKCFCHPCPEILTATPVPGIVVITYTVLHGTMILETACSDDIAFQQLPAVLEFRGHLVGKTGWSSDSGRACYKSSAIIATVPLRDRQ